MIPQVPTGIIRQVAAREVDGDDLAEFIVLLVDALELPEVADRVVELLGLTRPPAAAPRSAPPGLGRNRRGR